MRRSVFLPGRQAGQFLVGQPPLNNVNLYEPSAIDWKVNAQIDYHWGSPEEKGRVAAGVPVTNFSARFEGDFTSPINGAVVFFSIVDDWHRFYADGQLLSELEYLAGYRVIRSIPVEKGKKYKVKLGHKRTKGNYRIHLDGMFISKKINLVTLKSR